MPALFLLLAAGMLTAAAFTIAWRASAPSDGTGIAVSDLAFSPDGVIVQETIPDSPLAPNDRILAIAGIAIDRQLAGGAGGAGGARVRVGQTLAYDILRDGRALTVDVTLAPYPIGENLLRSWPSVLVDAVLLATSGAIFAARPQDAAAHAAITASALGVLTVAASGFVSLEALDLVAGGQFWRWYLGELAFGLLWGAMLHFALSFPEAVDPRRHRLWVTVGYATPPILHALVTGFAYLAFEDPLLKFVSASSPAIAALYVYPALVVGVLVATYVKRRDRLLRRQLRWLVVSLGGGAAAYLAIWVLPAAMTGRSLFPPEYHTLVFLPVPVAVGMAILRHRALNIEVVLGRSLTYGGLTVLLTGLYLAVVGLLAVLFPALNRRWEQALAAAVIALAVRPLHAVLQSLINKRLFGDREDPYRIVSTLAARMEDINTPTEQLSTMVETMGRALRLTYVAIELDRGTGREMAASFGTATDSCDRLPLAYQGEPVGQLLIGRRNQHGLLRRREKSMLAEVARHAGAAAFTARLTADLVQTRDRLVNAREEERRRLLRELHDGVGPTLAAVMIGLHAARRAIGDSSPTAMVLGKLQGSLSAAVTEIRKLARDLRPPTLDQLGLLAALEDHIGTLNSDIEGLSVQLHAPAELPPLPPAIDVAAYRIVSEALTNVVRHAGARSCAVHLWTDHALNLSVVDDGTGLTDEPDKGVGLSSMRERAVEVGGEFRAERLPAGGTRVMATLPLPQEPR